MKLFELHLDGMQIEMHKSILGYEKLIVNGKCLSSVYHLMGGTHEFTISGHRYSLSTYYNLYGLAFNFFKDNEPLIVFPRQQLGYVILLIAVAVFIYRIIFG